MDEEEAEGEEDPKVPETIDPPIRAENADTEEEEAADEVGVEEGGGKRGGDWS